MGRPTADGLTQLDTLPLAWATHRLGGIQTPANAQYSVDEVVYQLKDSNAAVLFTCLPLLKSSLEAAAKAGIPKNRIYILEMPVEVTGKTENPGYKTVNQLIEEGKNEPRLEELNWTKGEGARRTAFLCYSSGTSGLPKGVMISHYNVISNTMQIQTYDHPSRDSMKAPGDDAYIENVLGLLPFSHIYALGKLLSIQRLFTGRD
jgi:acyl-CoA synthetase (AMP-forming)/AMP-acid ligase II